MFDIYICVCYWYDFCVCVDVFCWYIDIVLFFYYESSCDSCILIIINKKKKKILDIYKFLKYSVNVFNFINVFICLLFLYKG